MSKDPAINNPNLDLILTRIIDVPSELVWKAWTDSDLLVQWFTPAPWTTVSCDIDLVPGGLFRTVMKSPEGGEFTNTGCYLEIIRNKRLVFTDVLSPGFRPSINPFFTGMIELEDLAGKTRYTATAMHKDEADRIRHEEMGFYAGWNKCLDQLIETLQGSAE